MEKINRDSYVIVSHKFVYQPDDDLVRYLNNLGNKRVLHIRHSFYRAKDRKSFFTLYNNGQVLKEKYSRDFKSLPEPLLYAKEFLYTVFWTMKYGGKSAFYVAMDGLLTSFGVILRMFKFVKKVAFWAIDYVPESRFDRGWKNAVYSSINNFSYRECDYMWDLSPRMAEAREKMGGIPQSTYKNHSVVPYGVWHNQIKRYSYERVEKHTIVYMGVLIPKQGLDLIIRALPEINKKYSDVKLKILGDGESREELEKLAAKLDVATKCEFFGKIPDEDYESVLLEEIAKSAVAVAPYRKELDTWTYYADPGKVKTYLSCGVPVLLTDIPWNAKSIESKKAGVIVNESVTDIADKICYLLDAETNAKYRRNAIEFSKGFDYNKIFGNLFNG